MMFSELYDLLGLMPDASDDQIKAAYRDKAKTCHPDVVPPESRAQAEQDMARLNHAYGILLNPDKRRAYDETGQGAFPGGEEDQGEAVASMVKAFEHAVGMDSLDPVAEAKVYLLQAATHSMDAVNKANRQIKKTEDTRDRLKVKKEGSDVKSSLLYRILTQKIEGFKASALRDENAGKVLSRAATLIDDYAYEKEPASMSASVLNKERLKDELRGIVTDHRRTTFFHPSDL